MTSYGNFDSLNLSVWDRQMIESAFQAVSSVEGGWEFLKTYEPGEGGFMFSNPPPKMKEINDAVSKGYEGHSGASYGGTMRVIQYIAQKGWDAYVEKKKKSGFPYPCPCHKAQGKEGWCGVAGGGVPACDH